MRKRYRTYKYSNTDDGRSDQRAPEILHLGDDKPLQRIGTVEDCMGPAVFLASHASDFMTGQIVYADGGMTAIG